MTNKHLYKELLTYYKNINKNLQCDKAEKKHIIYILKSNVEDFLSDNPEAKIDDIIKHFGSPESFQQESLALLNNKEIADKISGKRILKKWLILIGFIIILSLIIMVVWIILENSKHAVKIDENNKPHDNSQITQTNNIEVEDEISYQQLL